MIKLKYTGLFKVIDGSDFQLETYAFGFLQAFFLLTAEAISKNLCYQLYSITSENGNSRFIKNISDCNIFYDI